MGQISMCDKESKNNLLNSIKNDPLGTTPILKDGIHYLAKFSDKPPPYFTSSKNVLSITANDFNNTKIFVYQWSPRSLQNLREQRIKKNHPFNPEEMWNLMHQAVLGYEEIYEKEKNNKMNLKKELCISFDNMRLFDEDRVLKVAPPVIFNYQSPKASDYAPIGKNPITILGQVFLDLGLLQQILPGNQNLANYIAAFQRRYPSKLGNIIRKMIDGYPWDQIKTRLQNGIRISQEDNYAFTTHHFPMKFHQNSNFFNNKNLYDGKTYHTYYPTTNKNFQFNPHNQEVQSRIIIDDKKQKIYRVEDSWKNSKIQQYQKVNQYQKKVENSRSSSALKQKRSNIREKVKENVLKDHDRSLSHNDNSSISNRSISPSFHKYPQKNRQKSPNIINIAPPHYNPTKNIINHVNQIPLPLRHINIINSPRPTQTQIKFQYGRDISPHQRHYQYPIYSHHSPSPIKPHSQAIQFNENYFFEPSTKNQPLIIGFSGIPKQTYVCRTKPDYQFKQNKHQFHWNRHHKRQQSPTIHYQRDYESPPRKKSKQYLFNESPNYQIFPSPNTKHRKRNSQNNLGVNTHHNLDDSREMSHLPSQSKLKHFDISRKSSDSIKSVKQIINGRGRYIFPNGQMYDGDWVQGKMTGKGKYYYKDAKTILYEGEWKDDKYHGQGKIHNRDPAQLKGQFSYTDFNKLDNQWISYEGHFKDGKKTGSGILLLSNGQKYVGEFFQSKVHGKGIFYGKKNKITKGRWKNNILVQSEIMVIKQR